MKFSCTQFAWLAFTPRSGPHDAASARTAEASSAVGCDDRGPLRIAFRAPFWGACDFGEATNTTDDASTAEHRRKPPTAKTRRFPRTKSSRVTRRLPVFFRQPLSGPP